MLLILHDISIVIIAYGSVKFKVNIDNFLLFQGSLSPQLRTA